MKITYTGRQVELTPAQLKKLEARFAKIGKLLDGGKRECEAHVILSLERHLHTPRRPSITTITSWSDSGRTPICSRRFTARVGETGEAVRQGADQVARHQAHAAQSGSGGGNREGAPSDAAEPEPEAESRVHRVNHHQKRKPMTLDEAMLEMDKPPRLPGLPRRRDRPGLGAGAPPRRPLRPGRGVDREPCR